MEDLLTGSHPLPTEMKRYLPRTAKPMLHPTGCCHEDAALSGGTKPSDPTSAAHSNEEVPASHHGQTSASPHWPCCHAGRCNALTAPSRHAR